MFLKKIKIKPTRLRLSLNRDPRMILNINLWTVILIWNYESGWRDVTGF